MAYEHGTLIERLIGATFHLILDGTDISDDETPLLAGPAVRPDAEAFTDDFSMGRINSAKHVPKTKDRVREFYSGGAWRERTTKQVTEDPFEVTVIDYATDLFDQLAFGLAAAPVNNVSQVAFKTTKRYKDAWAMLKMFEEDGTVSGVLITHVRLEISAEPEIKNEDGSPVWRITPLADTADLDSYTPYPTGGA